MAKSLREVARDKAKELIARAVPQAILGHPEEIAYRDLVNSLTTELESLYNQIPRPVDVVEPEEQKQFIQTFRSLIHEHHQRMVEKGFWFEGSARNKGELIALMHSELSEALEAIRTKGDPPKDNHCPGFLSLEVEMADVVIRIMDFCGGFGLRLPEAIIAKMEANLKRPAKHGRNF